MSWVWPAYMVRPCTFLLDTSKNCEPGANPPTKEIHLRPRENQAVSFHHLRSAPTRARRWSLCAHLRPGVVVDVRPSLLDQVVGHVEPVRRRAHVQGGASSRDVDVETLHSHALAAARRPPTRTLPAPALSPAPPALKHHYQGLHARVKH